MQQDYLMTAQGTVVADSRHKVLRNTYLMLALSLVPTAIGAGIGMNLNLGFLRASPIVSALVILAIRILPAHCFLVEPYHASYVPVHVIVFYGARAAPLSH